MYKIAIIYSFYPDMTEAARELIKKKGYRVEVEQCVFERAVQVAKRFEAEGFDLIISRGATGALLQKSVDIPVTLVEITNFDILRSLYKAKAYGGKIAYFEYLHSTSYHDFAAIRKILELGEENLLLYYYENEEQLRRQVADAASSGAAVIAATGAFVLELAKAHGIKSIMVHSTKEAIYNAFKQAEDILRIRQKAGKLQRYFDAFASNLDAGLFLLDAEGEILYVNKTAETLCGISGSAAPGKRATDLLPPAFQRALACSDGEPIEVEFPANMVVTKKTLVDQNQVIGCALKVEEAARSRPSLVKGSARAFNRNGFVSKYRFQDIIGTSRAIESCIRKAKSLAKADSTVLITGESGTGKEVFANSIHNASPRRNGPFVAVNCATIPDNLLESELFGYEEGAFTGAKKGGRTGLFETADGGTIFLDEISEVPLSTQAQLLRVLQEKAIRRVGGGRVIPLDVRVIAATNADLVQMVKDGRFRADLYYRLNVLSLSIPPLRERKEDIPLLVEYFAQRHRKAGQEIKIPELFMLKLQNYPWPGNVRELENFIEKFVVLCEDQRDVFHLLEELYLDLCSFQEQLQEGPAHGSTIAVQIGTLRSMELEIIRKLCARPELDKTALAKVLGISRSTLWSKLKEIEDTDSEVPAGPTG